MALAKAAVTGMMIWEDSGELESQSRRSGHVGPDRVHERKGLEGDPSGVALQIRPRAAGADLPGIVSGGWQTGQRFLEEGLGMNAGVGRSS